jgi:hypothetical protein
MLVIAEPVLTGTVTNREIDDIVLNEMSIVLAFGTSTPTLALSKVFSVAWELFPRSEIETQFPR